METQVEADVNWLTGPWGGVVIWGDKGAKLASGL
jgi:hypothetical protein